MHHNIQMNHEQNYFKKQGGFKIGNIENIILDYAIECNKTPAEIMKMPVNHFFAIFYKKKYDNICKAFTDIRKYEQQLNKK